MSADHVVLDLGSKPPLVVCRRCGEKKPMPLPMALSKMTEESSKFTEAHRKCANKEAN